MKYFFDDLENVDLLRAAAQQCHGTPFRKGSCAPGVGGGMDCVALCEFILFTSGAVPQFQFPRRDRDYSPHVANDRILKYFRGQIEDDRQSAMLKKRFAELNSDVDLMPGDVLVMKDGVALYHLPIVIDPPRCLQCASPDGVSECDAGDPQYREKIVTIFRARALPSDLCPLTSVL